MKYALFLFIPLVASFAIAQKSLPPLEDGAVIDEKAAYIQNGPLHIAGHVRIHGITLDIRGPITVASGADLELSDVNLQVSDPPGSPNGTSSLRCEGPARIRIRHSTMTEVGSAHPIWLLRGDLSVDDFQTVNSEFHLDRVRADLANLKIFELEISHSSHVVARNLHLVFLSTHTDENERLTFADIPADRPFSRKLRMGSQAEADLTDTTAQIFLLYVHGSSDVTLERIGRTQLSIAPTCHGTLTLPHGLKGSASKPVIVPTRGASDCPFRFHLSDVNVDTWDVYAGKGANLTITHSVIDELTADGQAKIIVRDSEIYADWLSLSGDAQLHVARSTVGAQRLAGQRPDLATSEVRLTGSSHASFDHVQFDCGIIAAGNSQLSIRNPLTPPRYIRGVDQARVITEPKIAVEDPVKEH
ncbi:MAG TPA: hypothetical protein VKV39_02800 [Candidatus Sulfotelmatobacter sp.]|nr:hypothetical protein [Candidatus Sulfotelmatobacter sp.]